MISTGVEMLLKTKAQTREGSTPPAPTHWDKDRCAGGEVVSGGGTRSYSRRAAGSAPRAPHLLGKARPLWDGRLTTVLLATRPRNGMLDNEREQYLTAVRRHRDAATSTASIRARTPLPPFLQGACLAKEEGGVGGGTRGTARVRAGSSPDYNFTVGEAVLPRLWGCGGEAPAFAFPLQPIFQRLWSVNDHQSRWR